MGLSVVVASHGLPKHQLPQDYYDDNDDDDDDEEPYGLLIRTYIHTYKYIYREEENVTYTQGNFIS